MDENQDQTISRIMIQKSWNGYEGKGTGKTTRA